MRTGKKNSPLAFRRITPAAPEFVVALNAASMLNFMYPVSGICHSPALLSVSSVPSIKTIEYRPHNPKYPAFPDSAIVHIWSTIVL
ncbi:hypothetical protein Leryth_005229 [Lithospermum erythrorhizon]|nr:hypothetical protein Leryth_005229 [Lithospermum erythrorhizon]